MSTLETLQEPEARTFRNVALLTYVLGYDDLCVAELPAPLRLDAGTSPLTLGRATEGAVRFRTPSEIVVPDPWMSGRHAVMERRGAVDVLRDCGSTNGTFVNGAPIADQGQQLADGDLVEVGHSLFCYRLVPETQAAVLCQRAFVLGPTRTRSPEVAAIVLALERVASSNDPVLLLGETGTGKEIGARAVHDLSGRKGAFRAVHCGAIPETLFESTFFGHVRGAFTGATEPREGEIARCRDGTLFLDEIATMGLACQAKLLRVLEDGQVTKLGAAKADRFDVRWVAATNVDLFVEVTGFRSDLLRRLANCVVRLPPLRARREDLGALTAHVLREGGIAKARIAATAARCFFSAAFPGNIRDLHTLRGAARRADAGPIELEHLPQPEAPVHRPVAAREEPDTKGVEQVDLVRALEATGGNVVHVARMLGTHPRQVYRYIKRFSLALDDYRR